MKLVKPSFSIWEQEPGLEGIYKQIEKSAKVCYKSEGNITEDSAKPFIDNVLLKRGHYSPLEHGTVYLNIHWEENIHEVFEDMFKFYTSNPYSKIVRKIVNKEDLCPDLFISSNYRVLVEHNRLKDLKYLCKPTEFHEKRVTVRFILSRSIAQEYTRHRVFSYSMESQRYCNYSTDKFSNEVTFIQPCWADSLALQEVKGTVITSDDFGNLIGEYYYHLNGKEAPYFKTCEITPERNFIVSLQVAEQLYLELLNQGWKPQQAREVLPNACKTELVMTGFVEDWINFFKLRTASNAHPQARELAIPLREEFVNKKIL